MRSSGLGVASEPQCYQRAPMRSLQATIGCPTSGLPPPKAPPAWLGPSETASRPKVRQGTDGSLNQSRDVHLALQPLRFHVPEGHANRVAREEQRARREVELASV